MQIKVYNSQVPKEELLQLAVDGYGDMIKGVVDLRTKVIALGGELHADAEQILLDHGSKQEDLWGFNIYPQKSKDEYIEYTSLINIRPRQGNRDREIKSPQLRDQVKAILDVKINL